MDMNFQTVFDDAVKEEESFDTMFGAEEDDDLIGIVLGESGDEDEVDFETLDDGETAKELKDDLEGKEIEKPTIDSNGSFDIEDDSKTPGEDVACTKYGVADAVEKKAPDETNIEDEIDKSESKSDIDDLEESGSLLDFILGEEADPADPGEPDDLGTDKEQINDNDEAEELEDNNNPVNATEDEDEKVQGIGDVEVKEGEGCEDGSCVAPEETPVVYDNPVEDENLDDTFRDDDDDDDDDEEDDDDVEPATPSDDGEAEAEPSHAADVEEGGCSKKENAPAEDNVPVDPADGNGQKDAEASLPPVEESTNLDFLFKEEAEDATADIPEKVEDEIIADVEEDDGELSDEEADALADEGDDDDELIDMVLGED